MTASDVAQLLTALAAVGSCILSWRNSRKIEQVHKATNSMHDQIVAVTATSSRAQGRKDAEDEARTK
jgi:hypothetical protein